jgi:prevent-host-death family protein
MVKTLRESRANISKLVERASQGEDVLISVRGKVKARLTWAALPQKAIALDAWPKQLRRLQLEYAKGRPKARTGQILGEQRKDRG